MEGSCSMLGMLPSTATLRGHPAYRVLKNDLDMPHSWSRWFLRCTCRSTGGGPHPASDLFALIAKRCSHALPQSPTHPQPLRPQLPTCLPCPPSHSPACPASNLPSHLPGTYPAHRLPIYLSTMSPRT